jgi:hypothetical protein
MVKITEEVTKQQEPLAFVEECCNYQIVKMVFNLGLRIFKIYNYQFTIAFTTLHPHPHSSVGQASPFTLHQKIVMRVAR